MMRSITSACVSHGSWLNQAEIQSGAFACGYLSRLVSDTTTLQ